MQITLYYKSGAHVGETVANDFVYSSREIHQYPLLSDTERMPGALKSFSLEEFPVDLCGGITSVILNIHSHPRTFQRRRF